MNNAMSAAPARNLLIDTLRAFALIGVYMVHMFEQYEIYWAAPQQNLTHTIFTTFFMGKAFSLLTLCFGLSFFLLMDRAAKRGADFSGRFAWRMAILALIGIVHGLLYRGDILIIFGTLGLLLIPFYRASNRVVLILAAVLLAQPWEIARIALAATGAAWANHAPSSSAQRPGLPAHRRLLRCAGLEHHPGRSDQDLVVRRVRQDLEHPGPLPGRHAAGPDRLLRAPRRVPPSSPPRPARAAGQHRRHPLRITDCP